MYMLMKWWLLGSVLAILLLIVWLILWMGFADVPCQDGAWDEVRQTCVPT
jgi:hypothetical protein